MATARRSSSCPLARCHGRVLAQDIAVPIALQPFDNSAMDGYARRHVMPTWWSKPMRSRWRWSASNSPAARWNLRVGEGGVRITTGADAARGADTVVIREERAAPTAMRSVCVAPAPPAHNARKAGEDARPGDRPAARRHATQCSADLAGGLSGASERLPVSRKPTTVAVPPPATNWVEPGMPLQAARSTTATANC